MNTSVNVASSSDVSTHSGGPQAEREVFPASPGATCVDSEADSFMPKEY